MSMTKEEAFDRIKEIRDAAWGYHIGGEVLGIPYSEFEDIMDTAISALRPITREQVEKMRTNVADIHADDPEGDYALCEACGDYVLVDNFCSSCGSPLTDEAVDILVKRLKEVLKDET